MSTRSLALANQLRRRLETLNGLEQFGGLEAKGMLQHLTSRWPSDVCLQVSNETSVIFIRKADPTTLMPHSPVQVIEISFQTVW